jgi:hypothetical protein
VLISNRPNSRLNAIIASEGFNIVVAAATAGWKERAGRRCGDAFEPFCGLIRYQRRLCVTTTR